LATRYATAEFGIRPSTASFPFFPKIPQLSQ
jgi:hypothetical protein